MQTYSHFLFTLALFRLMGHRVNNIVNDDDDDDDHQNQQQQHEEQNPTSPPTSRCLMMKRRLPTPIPLPAVLYGSVLPDIPLIYITIFCVFLDMTSAKNNDNNDDNNNNNNDTFATINPVELDGNDDHDHESNTTNTSNITWTSELFTIWYFNDPYVITAHNMFHSPILLLFFLGVSCTISTVLRNKRQQQQISLSSLTRLENKSIWIFWMICSCVFHLICDIPVHHDDGPLLLFPFNWSYRFQSPISYWDPNYHGKPFSICEHTIDFIIIVWECRRRRRRRQDGRNHRHQSHLQDPSRVSYQPVDGYDDEDAYSSGISNEDTEGRNESRKDNIELPVIHSTSG